MVTPFLRGFNDSQVFSSQPTEDREVTVSVTSSNIAEGSLVETGDLVFMYYCNPGPPFNEAADANFKTAGWLPAREIQNLKTGTAEATSSFGLYYRFRDQSDEDYSFILSPSSSGNFTVNLFWYGGVDSVGDIAFAGRADAGAGGTNLTAVAPSVTTSPGDYVILVAVDRTIASEEPGDVSANNGMTRDGWIPSFLGMSMPVVLDGKTSQTTTSGATTVTWPNPHTNNGLAGHIVVTPEDDPIVYNGMPAKIVESGVLSDSMVLKPKVSGILEDVSGVRTNRSRFSTVSEMLAQDEFFWAHRGGTDDFPEMSQFAYAQSALLGFSGLEFSCIRTSDGVWFGIHDPFLDRTSLGTSTQTLDARTMTWAEVQSYEILGSQVPNNNTQPNRPYFKLEDFLDQYPDHVVIVDGKNSVIGNNAVAHTTEFLDILDAHGGPDRIITKQFGMVGDDVFLDACSARGYTTWGFFWGDNMATIGEEHNMVDRWPLLGINYDITGSQQVEFEAMITKGQRIVAHVIPTRAGVLEARSKGFSGFQCSGAMGIYTLIPPR